jgi:hypothetical protein
MLCVMRKCKDSDLDIGSLQRNDEVGVKSRTQLVPGIHAAAFAQGLELDATGDSLDACAYCIMRPKKKGRNASHGSERHGG